MNILFLNPPFIGKFSRTSRSPAVAKGGTLYYPIWLAYATGAAEKAGHQVKLVDAPANNLSLQEVFSCLGDWRPGLAVIDTSTPSFASDAQVGTFLKERFPDIFIVLVGTHPTALPQECLARYPLIDGVALGEYDATMVELAHCLERGGNPQDVAGLALRCAATIFLTPTREAIQELDALPFLSEVYQKHLHLENYFFSAANHPLVQIMTSRGCPHRCFFCVYPQVFHSRRYRLRSPDLVVDEFAFIQKNLPKVREVGIEDDCFTASPSHVRRICEGLIQRGINLKWYCNVRADVDGALLQLMKRAGCRLVTVGFESADQGILDNIGKNASLAKYRTFLHDAKKAGIMVHGCMMLGNPGETRQTIAASYEFAVKANCDSMQFYPLFVYPGTAAHQWAVSNNYLRTDDYRQWLTQEGLHNCLLDIPGLTAEELMDLSDHYLQKYHLRPRYILMKLWQGLRSPADGYRTLLSAIIFFGKIFKGQLGRRKNGGQTLPPQ